MGAAKVPVVQGATAELVRAVLAEPLIRAQATRPLPLRHLQDVQALADGPVVAKGPRQPEDEVSGVVTPPNPREDPRATATLQAAEGVANDVLSRLLLLEGPVVRNRAASRGRAQRSSVPTRRPIGKPAPVAGPTRLLVDLSPNRTGPVAVPRARVERRRARHRPDPLKPGPSLTTTRTDGRQGVTPRSTPGTSIRRPTPACSSGEGPAEVAGPGPSATAAAAVAPTARPMVAPPARRPAAMEPGLVPTAIPEVVRRFTNAGVDAIPLPPAVAAPPAAKLGASRPDPLLWFLLIRR